jgi:hypothetical protein
MFEFQRAGLAIDGQVVPVLEFGQLLSDFSFGFFAFSDVKFKGAVFLLEIYLFSSCLFLKKLKPANRWNRFTLTNLLNTIPPEA